MDPREALTAYAQAAAKERESFLYQTALKQARLSTRDMKRAERDEYLNSQAFSNLLYRVGRRDRVYQALLRGELVEEDRQAEFEDMRPLIESELQNGFPVDLPFLRSVEKCRVSLDQAHLALRRLRDEAPRVHLTAQAPHFSRDAAMKVEKYLKKGPLSRMVGRLDKGEAVLPHLMDTLFSKGVPAQVVEEAYRPGSLARFIQRDVERAYPELAACGGVITPDGQRVSQRVASEVRRAQNALISSLRRRFPPERLRRLLAENRSLQQLQKETSAALAREERLKASLLKAIPENFRDLYPLARKMRRHFILHLGPTNSGKTFEGVGRLRGALEGIYLGPLRLLAAEQFEALNRDDVPCSLVTGEEQILVPGSRVQSSTVEMADLKAHYDVAVIDECQMIADRDRGGAWTAAILGLCADEIHACASPDAEALLSRMILDCGDELTIVRHHRMTPLEVEKEGFEFPASVRRGDALIVFSKARVHAVAAELKRQGWKVSLIYGALPPDVRRDQAERFLRGETDVAVSTDAIAMGMNLPIQRVVFLESEKYDGDIVRPLTDAEVKQIAGRAGRYGQYDVGYVNACGFKGTISRSLSRPLLPLTEAVIGFPDSLLGIPLPLTRIIDQWLSMKDREYYSKASAVRMANLAAMMETTHTDKRLLYRFLCIPFDETETDLLERWRSMYHAECAGEHVDVISQIPPMLDPDECASEMLDGLEADYRRCDLYYNYARLFIEDSDRVLEEIQRRKYLISQGIIHILSTQRLRQRACPSCGKYLPWNWPYRLCENCHRDAGAFRAPRRGKRRP